MVKKLWQQHSFIILILVLALGLRLPQLNGSFWLDEAAQALESSRPWSQQLDISGDFQPPLIHLILFFAIKISSSEWWLRLVGALIPGLITIWATYEAGRILINKKTGLLASLLLATSSFHIFYSQELRPYSLPAMLAVLSWLYLIKATKKKKFSKSNWIGYTLTSLLGLFSSYLYPFLWLSQIIWLSCYHRRFWREIITSSGLIILGFLPWIPKFFQQIMVGEGLRQELPGWESVVSISQLKSPSLVIGKFIFGVINIELNQFFISISVILFLLCLYLIYLNHKLLKKKKFLNKIKLLIFWLVIPLTSAWIISFFIPVIRPKRVLYLLPAMYLLFSSLISISSNNKSKHLATIFISILLALNLSGTLQYHLNPNYQRENWKALYQNIATKYPASETVLLFSYPAPFSPWRWYDQINFPVITTGKLYIKNVAQLSLKIKSVSDYQYVLLFDYLRDLTDPDDQLRSELWSLGFHEINTLDYPNIGFVRVFSKNKPTAQLQL
ncbi:glycosyltransferase family 39 protein [Patescibacteria group bacterium]|nr:glycosyltransferase family 39 protein [Patescibacteria group bacterium]MBU1885151.1 glycosyltransferase family 39 protein [Patescibacteria group bacterium]